MGYYAEGKYCIVRCKDSGVFCGILQSVGGGPMGDHAELTECRRMHYLSGVFTLSRVAEIGPGKGSRLAVEVPYTLVLDAREVIPCQPYAESRCREFSTHVGELEHGRVDPSTGEAIVGEHNPEVD